MSSTSKVSDSKSMGEYISAAVICAGASQYCEVVENRVLPAAYRSIFPCPFRLFLPSPLDVSFAMSKAAFSSLRVGFQLGAILFSAAAVATACRRIFERDQNPASK
jgi:hypothetical protein